ncbi:MAG: hypothetical protein ING63_14250 [Rhodocyclaceae bacterium]|nr:hypothetical protein [Rhodocyclaceae bacterium]
MSPYSEVIRSAMVTLVGRGGPPPPKHGKEMSPEEYADFSEQWIRENDDARLAESCPDGTLAEMIRTAFYASLTIEESRPCRARILLCLDGFYIKDLIQFANAMPLSTNDIAKLSPACQAPNRALAIKLTDDQPKIIGLANVLADRHPMEFGKVNVNILGASPQSPLMVEILDPGHIRVSGIAQSTQYIRGTARVLSRFPEAGWDSLLALVGDRKLLKREQASGKSDFISLKNRCIDQYLRAWLTAAVRHAVALRQGGTLIFTPQVNLNPDGQIGVKYSAESTNPTIKPILNLIHEFVDTSLSGQREKNGDGTYIGKVEAIRTAVFDHAKAVAEMAAVDGCVILGKNASILGFGAKLSPKKSGSLKSASPPTKGELIAIEKIGGMRHQSTAAHVLNHKRDVAFVISQDGGVTAFWWDPAYPDRPTMNKDIAIPLQENSSFIK